MQPKRYEEVRPITRPQAERALGSGEPTAMIDALLRSAFHDPDRRWVQERCIQAAGHPDAGVRGMAALCLGHLARVHRALDTDRVVPLLRDLAGDRAVRGKAEDALGDVARFVPPPSGGG